MMIIEASQINSNGGIVLLELLLKNLRYSNSKIIVYIAYKAVYDRLKNYRSDAIDLKLTTPAATFFRYMRHREKVLFFCNLPPFVKNRNSVYYVHNLFYVNKPRWSSDDSSFRLNLRKYIYYIWIKLFINKVEVIGCQTTEMQRLLKLNFRRSALLLPFYEEIKFDSTPCKKEFDFFYPASSDSHKNNVRLLKAVAKALEHVKFKIALTIDGRNPQLLKMIDQINSSYNEHPILNLGVLSHEEVLNVYSRTKALLFPSLKESLGLPLIEANQLGLKVLVSDLPYAHDVLLNPVTFDPKEVDSIMSVILASVRGEYDDVIQSIKISNNTEKLLGYL